MYRALSAVVLTFIVTEVATLHSRIPGLPNLISRYYELEIINEFQSANTAEHIKILLVEDTNAFIGTKNNFYYVSLMDMSIITSVEWLPSSVDQCRNMGELDCYNYVRVLARVSDTRLYVCGTNALKPQCRNYEFENETITAVEPNGHSGTGFCPLDANRHSTFLYSAGQFYGGTVSDHVGRDSVIIMKDDRGNVRRTKPRDITVLQEVNFVSSHEKDDRVYFFFREIASEFLEQVVVSRVARVCKEDKGSVFTTFFKTRLSCYLHSKGNPPFYFNEIQSTSEFASGHYKPIDNAEERKLMIYGVFNTPENGVGGSAVCAFRFTDITKAFEGPFKGQESHLHKWLPIPPEKTPSPHPARCRDVNTTLAANTQTFITDNSLMNLNVLPWGDTPVLIFRSFSAKLTYIAVDWQVLAADGHYHDVLFLGTSDGRVLKVINKGGHSDKVEAMVIEDVQVLSPGDAVIDLRVLLNEKLLVVVSKWNVVTISMERCHRAETYELCMALHDPYCTCVKHA